MYAWRYLILGIPSAGLLGPVGLAWALGRLDWRKGLVSLALAFPLWLLAAWQTYLWSALLWAAGLVALCVWTVGQPRLPGAWVRAVGLLLAHLLVALGLIAIWAGLLLAKGQYLWLGGGLGLLGLLGLEWLLRSWRRYAQG